MPATLVAIAATARMLSGCLNCGTFSNTCNFFQQCILNLVHIYSLLFYFFDIKISTAILNKVYAAKADTSEENTYKPQLNASKTITAMKAAL